MGSLNLNTSANNLQGKPDDPVVTTNRKRALRPAEDMSLEVLDQILVKTILWESYGSLQMPEKKARVEMWINDLPYDWGLEDAFTARDATLEVYEDWLDWSTYSARSWLDKLDEYEQRFRIAGLKYHKIPHSLRHPVTLRHGARVNQYVMVRLSQIFETDRSRTREPFFVPWFDINNTTVEILNTIKLYCRGSMDVDFLKASNQKFDVSYAKLTKVGRILHEGIIWLEDAVARVAERSKQDGSDMLAIEYSREGSLFRRWMQTFPEVECGLVASKSKFIQDSADSLLEVGVQPSRYWRMLGESPSM
ncbi:Nn.00g107350.m01.CDS01 [Neocucurbitaria sp. VM-36]